MSQKTHTVKLRDSQAAAEQATDAELATLKKAFGRNIGAYDVTPIAPKAERPTPAPQPTASGTPKPENK